MTNQMSKLEWQVCDDEREWRVAQGAVHSAQPPVPVRWTGRSPRRWRWVIAALLVVLLPALAAGYQEVRRADQVMTRVENDVRAAVAANDWTHPYQTKRAGAAVGPDLEHNRTFPQPRGLEVRGVEVRGEYVMVEVWGHASSLAWLPVPFRQTRFYRKTEQGWLPTEPPDIFWQPVDTLRAGRFTFVYGVRDADAVLEAARQVEALDAELRTELGLPATSEALTVKVVTTLLTPLDPTLLSDMFDGATLYAPSPVLLALPAHITEEDALLQLIAGLLLKHALGTVLSSSSPVCAWQSLADGLQLWLLDEHSELPSQLLHNTQVAYRIRLARGALPRLDWLGPERGACAPYEYSLVGAVADPDEGAAPAFVEYTVAAYGRERLPALIDGMQRYDSWETLIPAVFGVSAADFEAGWQEWLRQDEE